MNLLNSFSYVEVIPSVDQDAASRFFSIHLSITEPGDPSPILRGVHQTILRSDPASFHGRFLQKKSSYKEKDRNILPIDLHRIFAGDFDRVLEQNRNSRPSKNTFRIRSGRHKTCHLDTVPIGSLDPVKSQGESIKRFLEPFLGRVFPLGLFSMSKFGQNFKKSFCNLLDQACPIAGGSKRLGHFPSSFNLFGIIMPIRIAFRRPMIDRYLSWFDQFFRKMQLPLVYSSQRRTLVRGRMGTFRSTIARRNVMGSFTGPEMRRFSGFSVFVYQDGNQGYSTKRAKMLVRLDASSQILIPEFIACNGHPKRLDCTPLGHIDPPSNLLKRKPIFPRVIEQLRKIMSANAVRQARFAERMWAEGKKKLTLWGDARAGTVHSGRYSRTPKGRETAG